MIAWIGRASFIAAAVAAAWLVGQVTPGIEAFDTMLAVLLAAFVVFLLAFWPAAAKHDH
jgi:hypothetical protein